MAVKETKIIKETANCWSDVAVKRKIKKNKRLLLTGMTGVCTKSAGYYYPKSMILVFGEKFLVSKTPPWGSNFQRVVESIFFLFPFKLAHLNNFNIFLCPLLYGLVQYLSLY
jgi:hypothetical protein